MTNILAGINLQLANMRFGRFNLSAGEQVPLHAHPNQHGVVYLLSGRAEVTSYRFSEKDTNEIFFDSTINLQPDSYTIITPAINIHHISALEDSVFLESFTPGVQDGMMSQYLKVIHASADGTRKTVELIDSAQADMPKSILNNAVELEVKV